MKNQDTEIIFITNHIQDNTTSAERYRSLAKALIANYENMQICEFDYPWKKSTWMGHETDNVDQLEPILKSHLNITKPKLNLLQSLIFFLFKRKYSFLQNRHTFFIKYVIEEI